MLHGWIIRGSGPLHIKVVASGMHKHGWGHPCKGPVVQHERSHFPHGALSDVDAALDARHTVASSHHGAATVVFGVVHAERLFVLGLEHADGVASHALHEVTAAGGHAVRELRRHAGAHGALNQRCTAPHSALHGAVAAGTCRVGCGTLAPPRQALRVCAHDRGVGLLLVG